VAATGMLDSACSVAGCSSVSVKLALSAACTHEGQFGAQTNTNSEWDDGRTGLVETRERPVHSRAKSVRRARKCTLKSKNSPKTGRTQIHYAEQETHLRAAVGSNCVSASQSCSPLSSEGAAATRQHVRRPQSGRDNGSAGSKRTLRTRV
jgi:hypothetical protein